MLTAARAWEILESAECVCTAETAAAAVARVAGEVSARLAQRYPVVLSVMGGGVVFSGQLLPLLRFPLDFDYVHATRYRGETRGKTIDWKVRPKGDLRGRVVLVVDDILDEGWTLAAIRESLLEGGAEEVLTAVFCEKILDRDKPVTADYVGVTVPDRYVFGFGMDVYGAWRNLPAVYALPDTA
ncbi:MAG: hypoxanthine-guanine phosphoribosyltransferase [Betaproteobacteria bacterium]